MATKRSSSQNAYYRGTLVPCLVDFFESCGEKISDKNVHLYLKNRFIPAVADIHNVNIECFMINDKPSTKKMSTEQFNTYKELIQQWASESFSLYIPDPNE